MLLVGKVSTTALCCSSIFLFLVTYNATILAFLGEPLQRQADAIWGSVSFFLTNSSFQIFSTSPNVQRFIYSSYCRPSVNFHLGARAKNENRPSIYPDINFCKSHKTRSLFPLILPDSPFYLHPLLTAKVQTQTQYVAIKIRWK